MRYFFYLLFLIQFQNCKPATVKTSIISLKKEITSDRISQDNYLINSIDKTAIGGKINQENKVKQLKDLLKNSFEREVIRPYMWDIFVSSNDTLLQFYNYKSFIINNVEFKSYCIKIDYEDGDYESILLVNESLNTEYNSMIVYEELKSEVIYTRKTEIKRDKVKIIFKSPNLSENLYFQLKNGMFLDYFDLPIVNKKWGAKKILNGNEFFEYQLKGKTNNHLKNGYWIEVKYSLDYKKNIIQDGYYLDGLRDGKWNFSPEGPVDMIKKFEKGKFIKQFYL